MWWLPSHFTLTLVILVGNAHLKAHWHVDEGIVKTTSETKFSSCQLHLPLPNKNWTLKNILWPQGPSLCLLPKSLNSSFRVNFLSWMFYTLSSLLTIWHSGSYKSSLQCYYFLHTELLLKGLEELISLNHSIQNYYALSTLAVFSSLKVLWSAMLE